jgi:hypothetical protein
LEGLGTENVVIFYDHLEYFTVGIIYGLWVQFVVIFYDLVCLDQKNLATLRGSKRLVPIVWAIRMK